MRRDRRSAPDSTPAPRAGRLRIRPLILTSLTAAGPLVVGFSPLLAQSGGQPTLAPTIQDHQIQLDQRRRTLDAAEQKAKSLEVSIAGLVDERDRLNQRLVETAHLIQRSESQLSTIEARLGELEAQEKILRGSLASRHDQIARLLAAMQRMGRNPPPVIITRREDALQMVRSAMLLARAFPELRTQALDLAERINDLVRVLNEARTESEKLRQETARLTDARTRLAGLMESKKQSVAERQKELEEVRRAAAEISRNVSDLSELIGKLDKVVAERTGLGRYDKDAARSEATRSEAPRTEVARAPEAEAPRPAAPAAASPQPAPPAVPVTTAPAAPSPAPPAQTPAAQPAPETKVAAALPPRAAVVLSPGPGGTASPGRMAPSIPFQQAKAQLPLPAAGRRVLAFGDRTQFGGQSKGIVLETRFSAQITSPCDGWVVYAGPFRSYGQLLIINAGNGYHVLLAGMSQIDVQLGQFILAAEPVGTMAPKAKAATQENAPVLYVEFRKDGRPVDPAPWWAEGVQKVQG